MTSKMFCTSVGIESRNEKIVKLTTTYVQCYNQVYAVIEIK